MLQVLFMTLTPSGLQAQARRNAWAGMSACAARTRTGREAEAALVRSGASPGVAAAEARTAR